MESKSTTNEETIAQANEKCQYPDCERSPSLKDTVITCPKKHRICAAHIMPWNWDLHEPDFQTVSYFYRALSERPLSSRERLYLKTASLLKFRRWNESKSSLEKLEIIKLAVKDESIYCHCCSVSGDSYSCCNIKDIHDQIYKEESNSKSLFKTVAGLKNAIKRRMSIGGPIFSAKTPQETDMMKMVKTPIHTKMLSMGYSNAEVTKAFVLLGEEEAKRKSPEELAEFITKNIRNPPNNEAGKQNVDEQRAVDDSSISLTMNPIPERDLAVKSLVPLSSVQSSHKKNTNGKDTVDNICSDNHMSLNPRVMTMEDSDTVEDVCTDDHTSLARAAMLMEDESEVDGKSAAVDSRVMSMRVEYDNYHDDREDVTAEEMLQSHISSLHHHVPSDNCGNRDKHDLDEEEHPVFEGGTDADEFEYLDEDDEGGDSPRSKTELSDVRRASVGHLRESRIVSKNRMIYDSCASPVKIKQFSKTGGTGEVPLQLADAHVGTIHGLKLEGRRSS